MSVADASYVWVACLYVWVEATAEVFAGGTAVVERLSGAIEQVYVGVAGLLASIEEVLAVADGR